MSLLPGVLQGSVVHQDSMTGQHQHPILRASSVLLWKSIRQFYDGGLLFLADDIAALAAVSPGCRCIYGALRLTCEPI